MKRFETFTVNILKRLGFVGIGLCAICCLLPIMGVAIGLGSLSFYAFYIEKTGMALVVLAVIAFIYGAYRKKQQTATCKSSCDCHQKAQS